jgi:hypothetical protein
MNRAASFLLIKTIVTNHPVNKILLSFKSESLPRSWGNEKIL